MDNLFDFMNKNCPKIFFDFEEFLNIRKQKKNTINYWYWF